MLSLSPSLSLLASVTVHTHTHTEHKHSLSRQDQQISVLKTMTDTRCDPGLNNGSECGSVGFSMSVTKPVVHPCISFLDTDNPLNTDAAAHAHADHTRLHTNIDQTHILSLMSR